MSFPRYPAYKDSGVEWLGAIPDHWNVAPLKSVVSCNDEVLAESTPEDFEIEYVEISGVDVDKGIVETSTLPFKAAASRARRIVRDGDVLVSTVRTYLRAIAPVRKPAPNLIASTGFAVLRPKQIDSVYLGYTCQAGHWISEVIARSVGVSYPAINASELVLLTIGLPPQGEQAAIATFLDRETAKIDALVAEQEQLITLLKEKRQAVISHAVTKGLDPSVPMKDSGVEWLGEVPEHWRATTLRRCTRSVETGGTPSITPSTDDIEEGVNWFTPGDFNEGISLKKSARQIPSAAVVSGDAKVFPAGAVLIVSIGATLGKVGLVMQAASANQQINAVIPAAGISSLFLAFSLLVRVDAMKFLSNASTIGIMNQEKTKDIPVAVPPEAEQVDIADHLAKSCEQFAVLIQEAASTMKLLQERRSALISAAVTGQIDVRGLAAPRQAAQS